MRERERAYGHRVKERERDHSYGVRADHGYGVRAKEREIMARGERAEIEGRGREIVAMV